MEEHPLVSVLINTRERPDTLLRCLESVLASDYPNLEVIVLDDCSVKHDVCARVKEKITDIRLRCIRSDTQLGVADGRNLLMASASGKYFVIIDDDATLDDKLTLKRIVDTFEKNPKLGILATKIINHRDVKYNFQVPFSKKEIRKDPEIVNRATKVSYYIGALHAISRDAYEKVGNYHSGLVFGGEELDFAYRAIKSGLEILYCPEAIAHHFPEKSVVSSGSKRGELYYYIRNRILLCYKHIPFPYILTYITFWTAFFGLQAVRELKLREFFTGLKDAITGLKKLKREPLSGEALEYAKKNYGRLWY